MISIKDIERARRQRDNADDEHKVASAAWERARAALKAKYGLDDYEIEYFSKDDPKGKKADEYHATAVKAIESDEYRRTVDAFERLVKADEELSMLMRLVPALGKVMGHQAIHIVRVAIHEHADELIGEPGWYKRTKDKVRRIADEALEGTGLHVSVYTNGMTKNVEISLHGDVDVEGRMWIDCPMWGIDGCAEGCINPSLANESDDGAERFENLTATKVRSQVRQFKKDQKRLENIRNRYRNDREKVLDKYLYLGLRDELENLSGARHI